MPSGAFNCSGGDSERRSSRALYEAAHWLSEGAWDQAIPLRCCGSSEVLRDYKSCGQCGHVTWDQDEERDISGLNEF